MIKRIIWLCTCLAIIVSLSFNMAPVLANDGGFTKIVTPFTVDPHKSGLLVEEGSVIHHQKTGVTEVFGPDNSLKLKALDSEAATVWTPRGNRKVDHVYLVPDNSRVEVRNNIAQVFDGNRCILIIIDDFTSQPSPPSVNGYLEWATASTDVDYFDSYWNVPAAPSNTNGSEYLYIFNAIQPSTGGIIMQPVLSWNYQFDSNFAHVWSAEPWIWWGPYWYDSIIGTVFSVSPTHQMEGYMFRLNGYWHVYVGDRTTSNGSSITANAQHNPGTQNNIVICAQEVYNDNSTNDLPGDIYFHDMVLKYQNNAQSIVWSGDWVYDYGGLQVVTYYYDQTKLDLLGPN